MRRQTVGQTIHEHNSKNIGLEDNVQEYSQEMGSQILKTIYETAMQDKHLPQYYNKDFYVVLVKTLDKMLGQPKFQTWTRISCPTPVYKQDVFKYHHKPGTLEFLWSIPDMDRYWHIVRNPKLYINKPETRGLAMYVLAMEDGSLLQFAKKENGEKEDAIIFLNKKEK